MACEGTWASVEAYGGKSDCFIGVKKKNDETSLTRNVLADGIQQRDVWHEQKRQIIDSMKNNFA